MIPNINKILYATDLSDNSAYAFRYAINSALKHDAGVIILHVFEIMSMTNRAVLDLYLDEESRNRIFNERVTDTIDRIRKRLKIFCDKEFNGDAIFSGKVESIEVCEGFPAEEILRKADEFSCDAIVMGTHGKDFVRHAFLGSTAKRVLRRTRKPVFIIPLPKGETDITFHDL
ncbi:MAG: universal stress protein [Desulfobacterales bacterium]|jgi:nucleotide-binding universal stress UspA family protein